MFSATMQPDEVQHLTELSKATWRDVLVEVDVRSDRDAIVHAGYVVIRADCDYRIAAWEIEGSYDEFRIGIDTSIPSRDVWQKPLHSIRSKVSDSVCDGARQISLVCEYVSRPDFLDGKPMQAPILVTLGIRIAGSDGFELIIETNDFAPGGVTLRASVPLSMIDA